MRVLILEDDEAKRDALVAHLSTTIAGIELITISTLVEFIKRISKDKFDLLIVDLVVPHFDVSEPPEDVANLVLKHVRSDLDCPNLRTPTIALTSFQEKAEDSISHFNKHDIAVVTFDALDGNWRDPLDRKIAGIPTTRRFDFIIVCALNKESAAFDGLGYETGNTEIIAGLSCKLISIANKSGVIITAPRMGLVSCAITATLAIEAFHPRLVCMSGICGGVPGESKIYDVVIAETCHQHDAGKWADAVFKPEIYSTAIDHSFAQRIRARIAGRGYVDRLKDGVSCQQSELPDGTTSLSCDAYLAPASSGSAVIASEAVVRQISVQQRKSAIFEMESYALYEAARLSSHRPIYFSAKTVVDDGGNNKGDRFHRIGCHLSAKVTCDLIEAIDFL